MCRFTSETEGNYIFFVCLYSVLLIFASTITVCLSVLKSCIFGPHSDHYGFVTFYNMEDAFAAIDNGGKLRRPDELPFDICFGGRRQFCNSNYADLGKSFKPRMLLQ